MSKYENLNVGKLYRGNTMIEDKAYGVVITVAAEVTNEVDIAIQVNDEHGKAIDHVATFEWYLSSDAAGANFLGTAHDGGIAIDVDGSLLETVANLAGKMATETDGDISLTVTDAGTFSAYLVIVLPTGGLVISDEIVHAT